MNINNIDDIDYNHMELKLPVMNLDIAGQLFYPKNLNIDDVKNLPPSKRIIAYHGWLDNSGSFKTMAKSLCLLGYALLAIDAPGCGLSQHKPLSSAYSDFDEAPLIIYVADLIGWEKFVLLAHSRGGGITAISAGSFPERIEYYIVFENTFGVTGRWQNNILDPKKPDHAFRVRYATKQYDKNLKRELRTFKSIEDAIIFSKEHDVFKKTYESAKNIVLRHLRIDKEGYTFTHDPRTYGMQQFGTISEDAILNFLSKIKCPVLLVLQKDGMSDVHSKIRNFPEIIKTTYDKRREAIENLELQLIPNVSHHLHTDNPEISVPCVHDFITKHELKKKNDNKNLNNKNVNQMHSSL